MRPDDTHRIERLAHVLDEAVRVPGTNIRLGLDSVLGLLPAGGDLLGGVLSSWIILVAARLGAPPSVLARMGGNVVVDALVGTVPVLGDLFDVGWKANRRNVELVRRYVDAPRPVRRGSRAVVAVVVLGLLIVIAALAVVTVLVLRWLGSLL